MDNLKLYCLIYELKGIVGSMSDMCQEDERFDNPLLYAVENKMSEIIDQISSNPKNDVLLETSQTQLETKTWGVVQVNAK